MCVSDCLVKTKHALVCTVFFSLGCRPFPVLFLVAEKSNYGFYKRKYMLH